MVVYLLNHCRIRIQRWWRIEGWTADSYDFLWFTWAKQIRAIRKISV